DSAAGPGAVADREEQARLHLLRVRGEHIDLYRAQLEDVEAEWDRNSDGRLSGSQGLSTIARLHR
ncbi:MAG TPA: hypothetical protein VGF60_09765, partial [Xanthobacteraceae bacterium]